MYDRELPPTQDGTTAPRGGLPCSPTRRGSEQAGDLPKTRMGQKGVGTALLGGGWHAPALRSPVENRRRHPRGAGPRKARGVEARLQIECRQDALAPG